MITIPMFPLSVLPLPGEMVPLHIVEPRYKELLRDAETRDIEFGIFLNHTINDKKIGSLMKLESVIKRYPDGESDIIVKCHDAFTMDKLYRTYKLKTYPGGDVSLWEVDIHEMGGIRLAEFFLEYLAKRNITRQQSSISIYSIAQELQLDVTDRYNFLLMDSPAKMNYLIQRIRYLMEILTHEQRSKDVYHLN